MSLYFALTVENNKNKKSVKFQEDILNFCDFIKVFVFTTNHHLNEITLHGFNITRKRNPFNPFSLEDGIRFQFCIFCVGVFFYLFHGVICSRTNHLCFIRDNAKSENAFYESPPKDV